MTPIRQNQSDRTESYCIYAESWRLSSTTPRKSWRFCHWIHSMTKPLRFPEASSDWAGCHVCVCIKKHSYDSNTFTISNKKHHYFICILLKYLIVIYSLDDSLVPRLVNLNGFVIESSSNDKTVKISGGKQWLNGLSWHRIDRTRVVGTESYCTPQTRRRFWLIEGIESVYFCVLQK